MELTTREEVIPYAKKLKDSGASNVLVSMSKKKGQYWLMQMEASTPHLPGRQARECGGGGGFHGSRISGRVAGTTLI